MRRKEKEILDRRQMVEIIEKAVVCRLGLCQDNVPYVVPLLEHTAVIRVRVEEMTGKRSGGI